MKSTTFFSLLILLSFGFFNPAQAAELKVSDPAPVFELKDHEGKIFNLNSRKGHWTVLYFYPKAGTPGCTKQAGAIRDCIDKIRTQDAEVFGISTDTVAAQADFHKTERLNFRLLADPDSKVVGLYGTKMNLLNMAKRWTFILDPDLVIRDIQRDVDPVADSNKIAEKVAQLKKKK